jgi:DNA-binding NtrC family response regulator
VDGSRPEVAVVVLTQYGTIESAVEVTRLGAMDYVTKPFRIEELRSRLERVARAVDLLQENRLLREQLRTRPGFGSLIGASIRWSKKSRSTKSPGKRRDTSTRSRGEGNSGWKRLPRWRGVYGKRCGG